MRFAAAGCGKVFTDKASGKLVRRPELDQALMIARVRALLAELTTSPAPTQG
jgi:hypothetical protein